MKPKLHYYDVIKDKYPGISLLKYNREFRNRSLEQIKQNEKR